MRRIELLAPAADAAVGRAAIDCGADAVYIGPPRFGARERAGNPVADIAGLAAYAHRYHARVYVTLNTLLTDSEVPAARKLAWQVYDAGVDALIIQDVGLIEAGLPPLPLIASTQMHNATPDRVAFLERVGFQRVVLARELDLPGIAAIRAAAPAIELECFVHGALCVGVSGRCYLSYALGGRSGNRGACAQPCRQRWRVVDADGRTRLGPGHLLSLKDLNLADHLAELVAVGVTGFKIEGRLKDRAYVMNTVAAYRQRLDVLLAAGVGRPASSGRSEPGFEPDLTRTFHRGFTTYCLFGRAPDLTNPESPKALGVPVGVVTESGAGGFTLDRLSGLTAGDGVWFLDEGGAPQGNAVGAVAGRRVNCGPGPLPPVGATVHRNRDQAFRQALARARPRRTMALDLTLSGVPGGYRLVGRDEDGVDAAVEQAALRQTADRPDAARATAERQLARLGDTPFRALSVSLDLPAAEFIPVSVLNGLRRALVAALLTARETARPRPEPGGRDLTARFPESALDAQGNVGNSWAAAFYRRHGVSEIDPALESGRVGPGRRLMTCQICLGESMGQCDRVGQGPPLDLVDDRGRRVRLVFECGDCRMALYSLLDPD